MKELNKKLAEIQQKLKAPKGQYNSFAKFNYRSCEDILESVKPLLGDLTLVIIDDIEQVGERYYVRAVATLSDGEDKIFSEAFAREAETKAGMDVAQITGASSSYARKYALNGLFAIDDTKDADTQDNTQKTTLVYSTEKPTTAVSTTKVAPKKPTTTEQPKSPSLRQIEAVVKIAKQNGEELSFDEVRKWTPLQASDYIGKRGNGGYYKAKEQDNQKSEPVGTPTGSLL